MKRSVFYLLLCFAPVAYAGESPPHWCSQPQSHPLDTAFARAMERAGGVTAGMRDAQGEAWAGWDAELNRLYREVMQRFGRGERTDALRKAQRAWLAWDDAEAASDTAQQSDAGTIGPMIVAALSIERRRTRACTLRQLLPDPDLDGD